MKFTTLSKYAVKSFNDLEEQVNALMKVYTVNNNFTIRSCRNKNKATAIQLFLLFSHQKMHNIQNDNLHVSDFFDISRDMCNRLERDARRRAKSDPEFKMLYSLIELNGIQANVEGRIKSSCTRLRFINKQIELLEARKKEVLSGNAQ